MPLMHVAPLSRLDDVLARGSFRRMISLLSIGAPSARPPGLDAADHLHLAMHDIAEERDGLVAPSFEHVASLLAFARGWDQTTPLLIHCYAGISRSTAAAFCIAAALRPRHDEAELAAALRRLSPMATPNPRIVALADGMLGREGRMIAAIRAIGRGEVAFEGVPFAWELG